MTFAPFNGPCPVCRAEHTPLKPANAEDSAVYQQIADNFTQGEIATLRKQVEKLTKERDAAWSVNPTVSENLLREQLAALADQNEKLRESLAQYSNGASASLSLPDLASPVLNRIRAEALREAATQFSRIWTQSAMVQKELHRMADELGMK